MNRYLDLLKRADQGRAGGGACVEECQVTNHQNHQNPSQGGFDGFVGRSDGTREHSHAPASETQSDGPVKSVAKRDTLREVESTAPTLAATACGTCRHRTNPGLAFPGYCDQRDDLPPAYGKNHPLHKLPADGGTGCPKWAPHE